MAGINNQAISTLGQNNMNPNALKIFNKPDTDSRIVLDQAGLTNVTPDFMFDHMNYTYICPTGNSQSVVFNTPINTEDRSLQYIVLDNSNNNVNKVFTFSPSYVFLDDPSNTTLTYTLLAGKKLAWFATWTASKLYLRLSSESTN
jgi:hypothetical protein